MWTNKESNCLKQLNKGTQHGSSLVGHKKHFPFFHKFFTYFIVLLRYFYNISNKPISIVNTSNILGIKSVILKDAWIFEMETFDMPLSAEMILISKPLAIVIKWWQILKCWKLSADEYLSYKENFLTFHQN